MLTNEERAARSKDRHPLKGSVLHLPQRVGWGRYWSEAELAWISGKNEAASKFLEGLIEEYGSMAMAQFILAHTKTEMEMRALHDVIFRPDQD